MTSLSDSYKSWLLARVSTPSQSIPSLERDFLMSELSLTSPQHNIVMWKKWLIAEGASGTTTSDLWYDYLGGLGYTGSLRDRKRKFFSA